MNQALTVVRVRFKVFKEIVISLIITGPPANFCCGSLLEPVTATLWYVPPL